jgi:hypothetical protein
MANVLVDPAAPDWVRHILERASAARLVGFAAAKPPVVPLRPRLLRSMSSLYPNGQGPVDEADLQHAVTAYHRRYIVPDHDLQGEYLALWRLTRQVAGVIVDSEVVLHGLVDAVQVTTVMPYHLWDIAVRLALLSGPQHEQEKILRDLDPDDPMVQAILGPQRRALQLAVDDVAVRVKRLEEFARLVVEADTAIKRRRALERLAKLNPAYEDVLAHLGDRENQLTASGHVADEIRLVIAEADGAVRRANEAGRSLAIPGQE